jgi:hypothetical protein
MPDTCLGVYTCIYLILQVVCVKFCKRDGLVMLGVGGAEPPYSAAPSTPGRCQAAKARRASFLCSLRWSMLR